MNEICGKEYHGSAGRLAWENNRHLATLLLVSSPRETGGHVANVGCFLRLHEVLSRSQNKLSLLENWPLFVDTLLQLSRQCTSEQVELQPLQPKYSANLFYLPKKKIVFEQQFLVNLCYEIFTK